MSDEANEVVDKETSSVVGNPRAGKRQVSLYGILGVMLAMLGYDYLFARPAVDQAYDDIVGHVAEVNKSTTDTVSNLDVRSLLGKKPSRTFNDGRYVVEVFSWRSGLPIRSHDLFTVYSPTGDEQLFYRHAKFVYEARGEISQMPDNVVLDFDPELQARTERIEGAVIDARNQAGGAERPTGSERPAGAQRPAGRSRAERSRPELEEDESGAVDAETKDESESADEPESSAENSDAAAESESELRV